MALRSAARARVSPSEAAHQRGAMAATTRLSPVAAVNDWCARMPGKAARGNGASNEAWGNAPALNAAGDLPRAARHMINASTVLGASTAANARHLTVGCRGVGCFLFVSSLCVLQKHSRPRSAA